MAGKFILGVAFFLLMFDYSTYCHALTYEQIMQLRKAGISDKTIQMMLQQEMDAKEANPYDRMGVREIKDSEGNVVTIYSTGRSKERGIGVRDVEDVDKAWKMLQNMIIDKRD